MKASRKTQGKNWYEDWFDSPLYHLLYQDRDHAEAEGFIENLLQWLQPPAGAHMLDMACGRGRHARLLASKGFVVTGTYLAPGNIAFAQQYENQNLSFFVHDMRSPLRVNDFDYVFNFFTSFGYFIDPADNLKTLNSVYTEMKQCGIFVLDFLNPDYVRSHYIPEENRVIGDAHFQLRRSIAGGRIIKEIEVVQSGERFRFTENVALLGKKDFEGLFAAAGLEIREVFGDYQLRSFDPANSPRCILIGQKNK